MWSRTPKASASATEWVRKHTLFVIAGLFLIITLGVTLFGLTEQTIAPDQGIDYQHAQLGDQTFTFDVVTTAQAQEQGLSGRSGLDEHTGMVFVFPSEQYACFWMKDMRFNLDILWLDAGAHIMHIEKDVSPATYPQEYCGSGNARFVIEIVAGSAKRLGLKPGDTVRFGNQ